MLSSKWKDNLECYTEQTPSIMLYSHYHNVLWEVRKMFKNKTSLINELERLYTLSDEKLNLKHLQTLSEEQLQLVVGGEERDIWMGMSERRVRRMLESRPIDLA